MHAWTLVSRRLTVADGVRRPPAPALTEAAVASVFDSLRTHATIDNRNTQRRVTEMRINLSCCGILAWWW